MDYLGAVDTFLTRWLEGSEERQVPEPPTLAAAFGQYMTHTAWTAVRKLEEHVTAIGSVHLHAARTLRVSGSSPPVPI